MQAIDISKRYGSTVALDHVNLTVASGDAHALVGRNGAGKSTLVSILTGLQGPDSGKLLLDGERAPDLADRDGWRRSVACVYQKSTIIPTLSIAENLFLNREDRGRAGLISWRQVSRQASGMLEDWGIDIDVLRPAADLTVEQRQMLEIVRALSFGARFIVLDEPTAQLDAPGIERLFMRLRALQELGVTILYISHHLEEIYEVCQTVTVFRDARHIITAPVADLPQGALVDAMTGDVSTLAAREQSTTVRDGAPVLSVRDLTIPGSFAPFSLDVRPGEVVGVTGSGSSGRIALAETIVGLRRASGGTVAVGGVNVAPGSVTSALDAGMGFVPRDRHAQGFVPGLGVAENATLTITSTLGRWGLVNLKRRDEVAREFIDELAIVTSGVEQEVASLSGGNQQKVVMARALANRPEVLVLMHPTAGVDVRSKETLLDVVAEVSAHGTGVVIVSDELEDLRPCDRVLVMVHGEVAETIARGWQDNEVVAAIEGLGSNRG